MSQHTMSRALQRVGKSLWQACASSAPAAGASLGTAAAAASRRAPAASSSSSHAAQAAISAWRQQQAGMGSSSNVVRGGSFALAGLLSGSKAAAMSTYPTYTQACGALPPMPSSPDNTVGDIGAQAGGSTTPACAGEEDDDSTHTEEGGSEGNLPGT